MSQPTGQPPADRPAAPPDPRSERTCWLVPGGIFEVHGVLHILSVYGHHLHNTLQARALSRGFATIAQYFGTAAVAVIMAHLYRGLMRCQALDSMLRARAKRGVDLRETAPRAAARRGLPADAVPDAGVPGATMPDAMPGAMPGAMPDAAVSDALPDAGVPAPPPAVTLTQEQQAAAQAAAAARKVEARLRREMANLPLTFAIMPSMAEIEAEVRRMPVGRTIMLICQDFGVCPGICTVPFWNRLFDVFRRYGGHLGQLMQESRRRAIAFERKELDHRQDLTWPEQTREGVKRILGFFLGETPVGPQRWMPEPGPDALWAPPAPVEAFVVVATGPP